MKVGGGRGRWVGILSGARRGKKTAIFGHLGKEKEGKVKEIGVPIRRVCNQRREDRESGDVPQEIEKGEGPRKRDGGRMVSRLAISLWRKEADEEYVQLESKNTLEGVRSEIRPFKSSAS